MVEDIVFDAVPAQAETAWFALAGRVYALTLDGANAAADNPGHVTGPEHSGTV